MSLSFEFSAVISGLSSSKLRERKDSLESLNTILKDDNTKISVKLFQTLIDSLIAIIESEKLKYITHLNEETPSNKVALCEERLSSAAYSLRLFIDKKSESFKAKHVKILCTKIFEIACFPTTTQLILPIAEHLSFSLVPLFSSLAFRLNLEPYHWVLLIKNISKCLIEQFERPSTGKCTFNLLQALKTLFKFNTIGLCDVRVDLICTLLKYFENIANETINTRLIIQLTNMVIIRLHLYSFHDILSVIFSCMRCILNLKPNSDELSETISQFYFLTSEILSNNVTVFIGEDSFWNHVSTNDVFEVLKHSLLHQLNHYDVFGITPDCLRFSESSRTDNYDLSHLIDLSLDQSYLNTNFNGWFRLISMVKFLKTYFAFLEERENSAAPVSMLYKRRKVGDTFSSILEHSFTVTDFLCNCMESSSFKINLISLQLTLFFVETSNIRAHEIDEIKSSIYTIIEDSRFVCWGCACLVPILSQCENTSTLEEEMKIMKLCIPLLKVKNSCRIACALLSRMIQFQEQLSQDDGILQLIYDIYELPNIQGPSVVSEEAFNFWKYIHYYSVDRNSARTSLHKIFAWIFSHWSECYDTFTHDNSFVCFIWWLFGSKRDFPKETRPYYPEWYEEWKNTEVERHHITLCNPIVRNSKPRKRGPYLLVPDISENYTLIFKVFQSMASASNFSSLIDWSILMLEILETLAGEADYSIYVSQFEEHFSTSSNILAVLSPLELLHAIKRLPFLRNFLLKGIILDNPKIREVCLGYQTSLNQEICAANEELDFSTPKPKSFSTSMFKDNLPTFMSFLLTIYSVNNSLNDETAIQFLKFAEQLPRNLTIICANIFVDQMLSSSINFSSNILERITQLLGTSMLSSEYNTSSISMEVLSKYLKAISSHWVKPNSDSFICADCNDIFEWIIARYTDGSFSEVNAFKEFSSLLIHLLQNFNLSDCSINGGKQRIFQLLSSCFDRLPIHELSKTVSQLRTYVQNMGFKNQTALFDELVFRFHVPQQSIEISACYTFFCAKISFFNDFYLNTTVCHMLSNTFDRHLKLYVEHSLDVITSAKKFSSRKELFHHCRFSILKYWIQKSSELKKVDHTIWEVELFGYNFDLFFVEYRKEIFAFSFAMNLDCSFIIDLVNQLSGLKFESLLIESLHLMIPLSYTQNGIMNDIFEIGFQNLGKKFRSILPQEADEVLYWFLKFTDLSNGRELCELWQKAFPNSPFSQCINISGFAEVQPVFCTSIPFGVAYKVIRKNILVNADVENCFTYCIDRLTLDLLKSQILDHQIKILREMKMLFLLFDFENIKMRNVDNFLLELSHFLIQPNTHSEAISLILDLLSLWRSNNTILHKSHLNLFRMLVRKLGDMEEVDKMLLTMLEPLRSQQGSIDCYRILTLAFNLLSGNEIYLNIDEVQNIACNELLCQESFFLLSDLFENYSHSSPLQSSCKIVKQNANTLFHLSASPVELSNKFVSWCGTLLGNFYSNTVTHFNGIKESNEIPEVSGLEGLVLSLYERHKKESSIQLKIMLENVISILLPDCNMNSDSNKHITLFEKGIIDDFVFPRYLTVEKFWRIYGVSDIDPEQPPHDPPWNEMKYDCWLLALSNKFISQLSDSIHNLKTLMNICALDLDLSEQVLLHLIDLLIYNSSRKNLSLLPDIFNTMSFLLNSPDGKRKTKMLIKIYCKIRTHWLKDLDVYRFLYPKFDHKIAIDAAISIGFSKTALLIFEDINGELAADGLEVDVSHLTSVYGIQDNPDFQYAIPVNPTSTNSLVHLSKTRFNAHCNFMFSNALYDQSIRSVGNLQPPAELKRVVCRNGFFGLSSMLSRLSHGQIQNDSYLWCLKLSKWNLPIPEKPNSLLKDSYTILKQMKKLREIGTDLLDSQLWKVMNYMSSSNIEQYQRYSLLSQLKMYEKTTNIFDALKRYQDFEIQHLDSLDEKLLDIVQWTRTHYLQFKSELSHEHNDNIKEFEYQLAKISSLSHQCNCARIQNRNQDLMNIVLMLNEAVYGLEKFKDIDHFQNFNKFCNRISVLQSARMLWMNGESSVPLKMLEELLKNDSISIEHDHNFNSCAHLSVPDIVIERQLVDWSSLSNNRSPEVIFRDYILKFDKAITNFSDFNERSSICLAYGNFCYKEIQKFDSTQIIQLSRKLDRYDKELFELSIMYKNTKLKESERKDAKRHFNRITLQSQLDKERLNNLTRYRTSFVFQALHFYLNIMVHTNQEDDEVIDKFCSLWFQYSGDVVVNTKLKKEIGTIPSFKFLPWVNQMVSKLSTVSSPFQETLQLTIKRMLYKLPYDTLYAMISMTYSDGAAKVADPSTRSRIEVVDKILKSLDIYDDGKYTKEFMFPIKEFCNSSIELAKFQPQANTKSLNLQSLNIGKYWVKKVQDAKLPLATVPVEIKSSQDGRSKERLRIVSVNPVVQISSSGLSLPKIVSFTLSDGNIYKVLMKGSNDDLRQDAIMEQVFKQVNSILRSNSDIKKHQMRVRTYEVIPLGPQAGIIEFVPNSLPLHDILIKLHSEDKLSFDKARKSMKAVQHRTTDERVMKFQDIMNKIKPQFRRFYFNSFANPDEWYACKLQYIKGVVTTSIIGYILGLGDRHLNNILIDKVTGEPIHIDLGVAFDQGKLLPVPELVPFRLTRDIVDGFGVTGVEGVFRKNCERVFGVLQEKRERLMCVLNILKWDPLYSWKMSPLKRQRLQAQYEENLDGLPHHMKTTYSLEFDTSMSNENENNEAIRALKAVEEKLFGNGLSVEAIVQELIVNATDVKNLATIYMGWSPFY